jgi:hypothetical protein
LWRGRVLGPQPAAASPVDRVAPAGDQHGACGPRSARVGASPPTAAPQGDRDRAVTAYPFHDQTVTVTHCGRLCFKGRKVNLSQVFAGQNLGVTQVGDRIWLVTFMQYDLGYFDDETCRLEPIDNPFGPKVLPMSPE